MATVDGRHVAVAGRQRPAPARHRPGTSRRGSASRGAPRGTGAARGDDAGAEAGLVVASHGRRCLVEDADGARHPCVPRGRRLRIVCGDRVRWQRAPGRDAREDGLVLAIEPRRNELVRPNLRGHNEVLAANVTQLVVVVAAAPVPDPFLVDRYLAQAALMDCAALIVRSKADLGAAPPEFACALAEWAAIDYPVLAAAAADAASTGAVARHLADHVSIFVGQSGVGKSTLLNALVPHVAAATGALSEASGEGRHTTSTSQLFHLPGGGSIIDSPGVRDYAPGRVEPRAVARGFREITALAPACRFADCLHLREPDCAVRSALEDGRVASRRYESYRRLVRLMEKLGEGFH